MSISRPFMADIPKANGRSVISSAESLNQLEERDLDALVADLGAESVKNGNADQPGAAPAKECVPAASLRPSNTAGVSTKVPKVSTERKHTLTFRSSANDPANVLLPERRAAESREDSPGPSEAKRS